MKVVLHQLYSDSEAIYVAKIEDFSTLMLTTSQTKQVNEERTMKAMLQADSNASRPPNLNGLYLSIPNHEVSYVIVAALKCLRIDRAQLIL